MTGEVYFKSAEVEYGRTEIFFQFVLQPAPVLDCTDQRAPVYEGNIERFHCGAKIVKIDVVRLSRNLPLYGKGL